MPPLRECDSLKRHMPLVPQRSLIHSVDLIGLFYKLSTPHVFVIAGREENEVEVREATAYPNGDQHKDSGVRSVVPPA